MKDSITYDDIADAYNVKFTTPSQHLDRFVAIVKTGNVLDVGCGTGSDAVYLLQQGFTVKGIDISENMIRHAQKKAPAAQFTVANISTFELAHNQFDGILAAYSLFHLSKKDVPSVLRKLHYALKPKGILYVAIQEGTSIETLIEEPLKPGKKMFLNIMTKTELLTLLNEAGFNILETYERKETRPGEFPFTKLFVLAQKI